MMCDLCAAGETRRLRHLGFDFDLCARCSSDIKGVALRPARLWTSILEAWRGWRAGMKDNADARHQFEVAHTPNHPEQLFICAVPTPQYTYSIDESGYRGMGLICPNPRQMVAMMKPVVFWDDDDREEAARRLTEAMLRPEATQMPGPGRKVCY